MDAKDAKQDDKRQNNCSKGTPNIDSKHVDSRAEQKPPITVYLKKKSLVQRVSDFYYCDDDMQRVLTEWCKSKCHLFPDSEQLDDNCEHSLGGQHSIRYSAI
jgi:hypothetical protein